MQKKRGGGADQEGNRERKEKQRGRWKQRGGTELVAGRER